ncbi:MAG TPA: hypothetical protein VMV45_09335 [Casimicrobiaceae bacterium]|nr:hypothetical protein [Casimicrobiaceae bacterium]
MTPLALHIGPLAAEGFDVQRSGLRWLREDGQHCRAGEVVAYCNIGLRPTGARSLRAVPFADERDLQVAFATPIAGVLTRASDSSPGGWLDQQHHFQRWNGEDVIASVEPASDEQPTQVDARDSVAARRLMLAGRRMVGLAEVRSGLLTGWHDRSRAWWSEGDETFGALLCLGICDQVGVVRGDRGAFLEMFEAVQGAVHVAYVPDDALVHCAAVATEQLGRSPQAAQDIAADFSRSFASGKFPPRPIDWMFAGALMASLLRSPITDRQDVLTSTGLRQVDAPAAVLLSLNAEGVFVFRHRRLGYALQCHPFRIIEAGRAVQSWLHTDFEQVRRTPEDIRRDYHALIDAVRERSPTQFFILNVTSTASSETIHSYAAFDRPLARTLGSVRARELNLMLYDLARDRNVAIVDVDAIAADLGTQRHVPDGIHGSAMLQDEIRRELLRQLGARNVRGFAQLRLT